MNFKRTHQNIELRSATEFLEAGKIMLVRRMHLKKRCKQQKAKLMIYNIQRNVIKKNNYKTEKY